MPLARRFDSHYSPRQIGLSRPGQRFSFSLYSFLLFFFLPSVPFIALTRLSFLGKYHIGLVVRGMKFLDPWILRACRDRVDTFMGVEQIVGEDCNRDVERGSDNWSSTLTGKLSMVMYNNYWPIVLQFYSLDSMISSFNVFSLSLRFIVGFFLFQGI